MRLSAFKKLNFGLHGVQEMFFRHAKKIRSIVSKAYPMIGVIIKNRVQRSS